MKKIVLLSALLVATSVTATELTVVGSWSNLGLHKDFEKPFWSMELSKATNNAFQAQVTTFDQMGIAGADVYRYLNDGMFDVGMTVADYTVSDAPELEGLDISLIAPDVATAKAVAEAFYPIAEATAAKRFNAHVLAIVPYPQQVLFCKGEVKRLADIKGKKVRGSGRSTGEFLQAMGAESVNIPFNEVPGALERGVIDCAVTGSMSGYSAKWYEVTNLLLPIPVGGWDDVITMINLDKWKALGPDEQALLQKTIDEKFTAPVWANAVDETKQGIACLTDGECSAGTPGKMQLVNVSDADIAAAKQVVQDKVLPNWAARVDAQTLQQWNDSVGKVTGLTAKVP